MDTSGWDSGVVGVAGVERRSWPQAALIASPSRSRNWTLIPASSRISRKRIWAVADGVAYGKPATGL